MVVLAFAACLGGENPYNELVSPFASRSKLMIEQPARCVKLLCIVVMFVLIWSNAVICGAQSTQKTAQIGKVTTSDTDKPADLSADSRLDLHVTLHEIGIPIRSLLAKVSTPNVPLDADRDCRELEIHINIHNRTMRSVMVAIADLVPGTWFPSEAGKGYTLVMTRAAVRRRKRWWELYLGERQRVLDKMAEYALQAMGATPEIKGEVTAGNGDHEAFRGALLEGSTFFHNLPASLQGAIAHSLNSTPLYQDSGLMFLNGMDEGGLIVPLSDLPEQAQQGFANQLAARKAVEEPGSTRYVLFENVGSTISADAISSNGTLLPASFSMEIPISSVLPAFDIDQRGLLSRVLKMGNEAPPAWRELAVYQASRVWTNDFPAGVFRVAINRAQYLEWLASTVNMEFIADYYSIVGGSRQSVFPTGISVPLKTELDRRAVELDMSWKQQDGLYLFRNNRWYRDDGLEVPADLIKKWLERDVVTWGDKTPSDGAANAKVREAARMRRMLDWQAEVVTMLSPWQIFNGLKYATVPPEKREQYAWGSDRAIRQNPDNQSGDNKKPATNPPYAPFKRQVTTLISQYRLIQLFATLDKARRTELMEGRLNFNSLSPDQQSAAVYLNPWLRICLSQHIDPIFLGLRRRMPSLAGLDAPDLQLYIVRYSSEPSSQTGNRANTTGQ